MCACVLANLNLVPVNLDKFAVGISEQLRMYPVGAHYVALERTPFHDVTVGFAHNLHPQKDNQWLSTRLRARGQESKHGKPAQQTRSTRAKSTRIKAAEEEHKNEPGAPRPRLRIRSSHSPGIVPSSCPEKAATAKPVFLFVRAQEPKQSVL